jgi:hypothetical protein
VEERGGDPGDEVIRPGLTELGKEGAEGPEGESVEIEERG